jgi:hypothetical protein
MSHGEWHMESPALHVCVCMCVHACMCTCVCMYTLI